MFNFQISKEKADNDENVIRPVKNSKIGGRWGMETTAKKKKTKNTVKY